MVSLMVDWLLPNFRAAAENEPSEATWANAARDSREWRMGSGMGVSVFPMDMIFIVPEISSKIVSIL